jgi:hypothetical protein
MGGYAAQERESLPAADFLKPETRSWPVSDKRHAEIALQYMAWGRGNRAEYPKLLKRLFELYPPDKYPDLAQRAKRLKLMMSRSNPFSMHVRHNPAPAASAEITTARFPSKCARCGQPFEPRVTEIVDSGERGPKGGKKMMHAHAEECG